MVYHTTKESNNICQNSTSSRVERVSVDIVFEFI